MNKEIKSGLFIERKIQILLVFAYMRKIFFIHATEFSKAH